MDSDQYIRYIEAGLGISPKKKQFRKLALGPLFMILLMGIIPCVVLGGYWLILLSIMLITTIAMTLTIFIMSSKPLTIRNRLEMQALLYTNWVFQVLMIETMFFLIAYGVNFVLVLIYIPPLATPLALGLKNAKKLRMNGAWLQKKGATVLLPFGWAGMIGVCLAKSFFRQATNQGVMVFVIVSLTALSCAFSIGLLAYQRIFYLKKYIDSDVYETV